MIKQNKSSNKSKFLTGKEQDIVAYLLYIGPSYTSKIAEEIGLSATVVSKNLRLLKNDYPDLLTSDQRKKPDNEIRGRDEAMYHKISDEMLAEILLIESLMA